MKKLLIAMVLVLPMVASVGAQRIFTRPTVPSSAVLDRLNLTAHWRFKVPLEGQREGLFTVQLIPAKDQPHLAVQTFSGAVYLLDAETGDLRWKTQVGTAYWPGQPVGFNEKNIFATRRDQFYVLNRKDGAQRVYTIDKDSKLQKYGFTLLFAPSAAPVVDDEMLSFSMGNRLVAYEIPDWDYPEGFYRKGGKELTLQERLALLEKNPGLVPERAWSYLNTDVNIDQSPLPSDQAVGIVTTGGNLISFNKYTGILRPGADYQFNGGVAAAVGQHGGIAYIGAQDSTVYAVKLINGTLVWRFLSQAPILVKPEVTNQDVFVSSHRLGLYRLDRSSGRDAWLNKLADRFLATNQKYVYALDRTGRMLVLDYARGTSLAACDMRDWTLPIPNEWTDRIYFASHDGQILCLRCREDSIPLKTKTFEVKIPVKIEEKEAKKEEPKELEKEKDKEKEKEKEKDKDKVKPKEKDKDKEKIKDKDKDKDKNKDKAGLLDVGPQQKYFLLCDARSPEYPAANRQAEDYAFLRVTSPPIHDNRRRWIMS